MLDEKNEVFNDNKKEETTMMNVMSKPVQQAIILESSKTKLDGFLNNKTSSSVKARIQRSMELLKKQQEKNNNK